MTRKTHLGCKKIFGYYRAMWIIIDSIGDYGGFKVGTRDEAPAVWQTAEDQASRN